LPMKYFVVFSLIICVASVVLAEETPRDVPEDHWATEAVYDLVKLGVTSGYPDGTFRGTKQISRYEVSSFISKLANSLNFTRGKNEKLLEEFKTELALVQYKKEKAAWGTHFKGEMSAMSRLAIDATRGAEANYRLKLSLVKNFDPASSLKIGLDTMDAGYGNSTPRNLATELLDFEGKVKLPYFDLKAVIGPGLVVHQDSTGLFPYEERIVVERPFSALEVSSRGKSWGMMAGFIVRRSAVSGSVALYEITGSLNFSLNNSLRLGMQPSLFSEVGTGRDLYSKIFLDYAPDQNSVTNILLGIGGTGTSSWHLRVIQEWQELFGWGLTLRVDKLGSSYRPAMIEDEVYFLDNFNRPILDGTTDLGWSFSKRLGEKLRVEENGNLSLTGSYQYGAGYPGTNHTEQLSLVYDLWPQLSLQGYYRFYNVPSGLSHYYKAVATRTNHFGFEIKHAW